MIVDSFVRVNDPEATARWRLGEDVHCRIVELPDGTFGWQSWSEAGGMMGPIDSGHEPTSAKAERAAKSAAVALMSEALSSSEGARVPGTMANQAEAIEVPPNAGGRTWKRGRPPTEKELEQLRKLHELKRTRPPTEKQKAHLLRLNGPRLGRDRLWWSCWGMQWRLIGMMFAIDSGAHMTAAEAWERSAT